MNQLSLPMRYALIGLALGAANLVWRATQGRLTGDVSYDAVYILGMLGAPALIGYAIGLYRVRRGKQ
jgi:cytochrome bd-type quinol oxidase subunit 2